MAGNDQLKRCVRSRKTMSSQGYFIRRYFSDRLDNPRASLLRGVQSTTCLTNNLTSITSNISNTMPCKYNCGTFTCILRGMGDGFITSATECFTGNSNIGINIEARHLQDLFLWQNTKFPKSNNDFTQIQQPGFLENKRHLRCTIGHLLIDCELSIILHHCDSLIFYHTYIDQAKSVTALH